MQICMLYLFIFICLFSHGTCIKYVETLAATVTTFQNSNCLLHYLNLYLHVMVLTLRFIISKALLSYVI